jgi:hypothetical protein
MAVEGKVLDVSFRALEAPAAPVWLLQIVVSITVSWNPLLNLAPTQMHKQTSQNFKLKKA